MKTITQALKAHTTSVYLITGAAVLAFALVSCGGGGGYGGGGMGMIALPPAAFGLSTPMNGAKMVGTMPILTWGASLYATSYSVEVSNDNFATLVTLTNAAGLTALTYTVAPPLAAGTYSWRVKAFNVYGMVTSATFTFST